MELAEDTGITLGETGAIATNSYRETNQPKVYTASDCAEAEHVVTDKAVYVPALTANRHGQVVGQTVVGTPTEGGGVAGTAAVKAFDVGGPNWDYRP